MVAVGNGEGEGWDRKPAAVVLDPVGLGRRVAESEGGGAQVVDEAALLEPIEAGGDFRFKSEACHSEERMAVGEAGIDGADMAGAKDGENMGERTVHAEMAAEAVAGTARNESEGGGRADELAGDLVEGAIATDGDDKGRAARQSRGRKRGGVQGRLREHDIGAEVGGEGAHRGQHTRGEAGAGINDEKGAHGKMTKRRIAAKARIRNEILAQ